MSTERLPLNALQKAIYAALEADPTLSSEQAQIGDLLPDDAGYPQVVIGEFTADGVRSKGSQVSAVSFEVETYSSSAGFQQLNTMMDAITQAVTSSALLLDAPFFAAGPGVAEIAEARAELDAAGRIVRHGQQTFRFFISQ